MIIATGPHGLSLEDADDFGSFHVDARGLSNVGLTALAEQSPEVVARIEDDHLWIRIAFLASTTGHAADAIDADWQAGFQKMVAYARQHGWVDEETGSIRAHVENLSGS